MAAVLLVIGGAAGCASGGLPPPPDAAARAAATTSYSGRLRVSLRSPSFRARAPVLVAFNRPDALRIEVPGPAGARLIAVASGDALTAVFPGDRAAFVGRTTAERIRAWADRTPAPSASLD